jgi:Fur family ferric uptake transcriptional regulator
LLFDPSSQPTTDGEVAVLLIMSYHYRTASFDRSGSGLLMVRERDTRQRDAIRSVIRDSRRPLSPGEVLDAARPSVNALGLATVYRTLKLLVEEGAVQVITLPGESPRYEMAESAHHHHFQCVVCRRVFDVPGCPGDLHRLAPRGFSVEHHDVTLYGRCPGCPKRGKPASR